MDVNQLIMDVNQLIMDVNRLIDSYDSYLTVIYAL